MWAAVPEVEVSGQCASVLSPCLLAFVGGGGVNAVCARRPAEWWETGDPGNRLAMLLCRNACGLLDACPGIEDGRAYGMVAAGRVWSDFGRPLRLCGCGRPVVVRSRAPGRGASGMCRTCDPPPPLVWPPRRLSRTTYWRKQKRMRRAASAA